MPKYLSQISCMNLHALTEVSAHKNGADEFSQLLLQYIWNA